MMSFIFCIISYPMIGFRSGVSHFFVFYGTLVISSLAAMSYGYCISAVSPSVPVAAAISSALYLPFIVLGGFYQRSNSVKTHLLWIKFTSWVYYGFQILMTNQWSGINLDTFNATSGECTATTGAVKICQGDEILEFYSVDADDVGRNVGLLFVIIVGFRLFAILILMMRVRNNQK
ncbi:protein white-like [Corticium candelabrum]|uniref:protein white-like n=1 Tax=Corticium candelabrum TaxID=121492 RepID=UPI002E259E83|nr:protein white-like [Corticium candelabrum]